MKNLNLLNLLVICDHLEYGQKLKDFLNEMYPMSVVNLYNTADGYKETEIGEMLKKENDVCIYLSRSNAVISQIHEFCEEVKPIMISTSRALQTPSEYGYPIIITFDNHPMEEKLFSGNEIALRDLAKLAVKASKVREYFKSDGVLNNFTHFFVKRNVEEFLEKLEQKENSEKQKAVLQETVEAN